MKQETETNWNIQLTKQKRADNADGRAKSTVVWLSFQVDISAV